MIKDKFVKINNYLREIPKTYRDDMRVSARIYISDKIWEYIEDEALIQLVNSTTLPGIVKYAIAMPDIHTGYGPPIGGVGAMKLPDGVISPGFVGYDENCTSGDTDVLLEHGAFIPIKHLEKKWENAYLQHVDFKEKNITTSLPIRFLKKFNNPHIFKIITSSGESVKVTENHPVYTKEGMKEVRNIKKGQKVAIFPFKGVKYREPSNKIILSEDDFIKVLSKLKTSSGSAKEQVISFLRKINILPLKHNSPQLPYLLKIMGYVLGDGTIPLIKNSPGPVTFYGKPEDLEDIRKDIKIIGFRPSEIYSRTRDHEIKTHYKKYKFTRTEYSFRVNVASFAILLVALGLPYGSRSKKKYRVPRWVLNCSLWQKRLFLAGLFGAELSTPSTMNKYNFYAPQLNMQKSERLKTNAKLFLKDIKEFLNEFKIKTHAIKEVPGYKYKGKRGNTSGFRLQISEKADNLIKFFQTVSYEYNQEKFKKACLAANYLKKKLRIVDLRTEAREQIEKLYKRKGDFKKLVKKYSSKYTPAQFLYHSIFEEESWGVRRKRGSPRIAFNFPSFDDYIKSNAYGSRGLVWDEIEKIEKISYKDYVYDFTVNHPDHNFIANNFVVSNCGIRILKSEYSEKEISPYLDKLAIEMQKEVPSGLGRGRQTKLSIEQINRILEGGVPHLVNQGYGNKEDIENCEEKGKMEQVDASCVSQKAKMRGRDQVGTLGSGNHFVSLERIVDIYDEKVAEIFGLFKDQVIVMIHTGSRGLGHQNCTDYLRIVMQTLPKYNIKLPDRELACVPFNSSEGERFFKAMSAASNFAWSNRHMISHYVRKAWKRILGEEEDLRLLYDVAHNIAKIEEHEVDGERMKLIIHRKGATRAFPPNHPEIPEKYKDVGQPVIVPGSMGTPSYVMVGTEESKEAWHTVCHGAGRIMSRHAAIRVLSGQEIVKELEQKGILIKCRSMRGIAEEAPQAYKNIDEVVEVVHQAGLSKKVARLKPLAVIKGE